MKRYPKIRPLCSRTFYDEQGAHNILDMIRLDDQEYWAAQPDPQRYVMPSKRIPKMVLPPVQNHVFLHNIVRFGYSMLHP